MQCPKCKNEIPLNIRICPYCHYDLKNGSTISKNVRSKITDLDKSPLIGGTLSRGSFIRIVKKNPPNQYPNPSRHLEDNNYPRFFNTTPSSNNNLSTNSMKNISPNANYIANDNISNNQTNDLSTNDMSRNIFNNNMTNGITNDNMSKDMFNDTITNDNISNDNITNNNLSPNIFNNNLPNDSNNYLPNGAYSSGSYKDNDAFINIVSINQPRKSKNNLLNIGAYLVVIGLWIFVIYLVINENKTDYFFKEDPNSKVSQNNNTVIDDEMIKYDGVSKSGQKDIAASTGVTSIIYDNQYTKQFTISSLNDVERLISTDSVKQKTNCPQSIINIENEIIENYGIIAVNFCEMDESFAKELRDVVKYIYNQYPQAREYLTNLTLANVEDGQSYMAAFMPIFTFATSNTNSGYPVAIKTQIILNAKYFLNTSKIKNSVSYGVKTKYFPKNATRSSTVAHEFGHYLSYIALLNTYKAEKMTFVKSTDSDLLFEIYDDFNEGNFSYNLLVQAYEEYKKEIPNISFEEFRNTISQYAIAKDSYGEYIYDETIAEAFHDVYLNGSNAALASRLIIKVLESKL